MEISIHHCQDEVAAHVAAYLDGQLDVSAITQFEAHVERCEPCRIELNAQRQFLCTLDSTLSGPQQLPIPKDFARIVSARAESDMRGVRHSGERRLALLVSIALGVTALALLGATAENSLLLRARSLINKVFGVASLLWTALHDAFVGLSVISRMVLPQSPLTSLAALVVLAFAVASLSHLIISYHRRDQIRLSE